MKKEFETELSRQGFVSQETSDGYYNITSKNRIVQPITLELVISKSINLLIHGSQNGNELDGIGCFLFSLNSEQSPDYFAFVFRHLRNESAQFMIIPTEELRRRLKKNIVRYRIGEHLELRLWLMGGFVYDSSSLGVEGEYYYLSVGRGGRLIDLTDWNYTRFWNNWILDSVTPG